MKDCQLPSSSARRTLILLGVVLCCLSLATCKEPPPQPASLSQEQVAEIVGLFVDENPASYRLSLPVVEGDETSTEVYGAMPLSQVRRIASEQNITFNPDAHIHVVVGGGSEDDDGGDGGSGGAGGSGGSGPGSHINAQSNRLDRLRQILETLDQSQYQLIIAPQAVTEGEQGAGTDAVETEQDAGTD